MTEFFFVLVKVFPQVGMSKTSFSFTHQDIWFYIVHVSIYICISHVSYHLHRWILDVVDRLPRNSQRWHRRSSFHQLIVDRYAGVDINCLFYLEYQRIVMTKKQKQTSGCRWYWVDGHIQCRYTVHTGTQGFENVHATVRVRARFSISCFRIYRCMIICICNMYISIILRHPRYRYST